MVGTRVLWRVSVPHFDFTLTARVSSQSHVTRGPRASTCSSVGRVSASWLTGTVRTQGGKALCRCWEGCAEETRTLSSPRQLPLRSSYRHSPFPFTGTPHNPPSSPRQLRHPYFQVAGFRGEARDMRHEGSPGNSALSCPLGPGPPCPGFLGSWSLGFWVPWVPVPRVLGLLGPGFLGPRAPCSLACPSDSSLCVSVSRLSYIYKAHEL